MQFRFIIRGAEWTENTWLAKMIELEIMIYVSDNFSNV